MSLLGTLLVSIVSCRFSNNTAGEVGPFAAWHVKIADSFWQAAPAIMTGVPLYISHSLLEYNQATEVLMGYPDCN